MRLTASLAATTLVALLLAAGPSAALDFGIKDRTPVDVKDHTPIEVKDNTPINVIGDPTPINIANPKAGLNDAVLAGVLSPAQLHAALEQGLIVLSCELGTTDLLVANAGSIDIPAGTKLRWSVKQHGAQGYVQLKRGLQAGADVRVADVLNAAAKAGAPCSVKPTGL